MPMKPVLLPVSSNLALQFECAFRRHVNTGEPGAQPKGTEQTTAGHRDCVKTRMATIWPLCGYTKSEPGAVATGSFP